ncbi:hypothetical protein ACFYMX_36685 [Streptomyces griseofuscus]|uniref:hypothetical protein n=1 Tax=Streptomyces TaxID=1883 RepID=UPI00081DD05A|nr:MULTISPECIES: hypothetical protein [unclassified Streptomyces]MYQ94397.1 hypothetical protein [Streptomyces sp. SID4946]SCF88706.1 hypothetical protein GA0115256_128040 [Streptomyces sp. DconLS]SCF90156.1 hypothetical protein GA0115258_116537 [Streptomyces sp. LamerLS-31b]
MAGGAIEKPCLVLEDEPGIEGRRGSFSRGHIFLTRPTTTFSSRAIAWRTGAGKLQPVWLMPRLAETGAGGIVIVRDQVALSAARSVPTGAECSDPFEKRACADAVVTPAASGPAEGLDDG